MSNEGVSQSKRRLLERIKILGEVRASDLSAALDITDVAVRQHLQALEDVGLVVQQVEAPSGRGRPAILWKLTDAGHRVFPQRSAELTVDLIGTVRETFGEAGLAKLIEARADRQLEDYRKSLPGSDESIATRVKSLAERRTAEGYMAEVIAESDGSFLLIEHHCPICDAAKCCLGLCVAELRVFQEMLGRDVHVERCKHLLEGDDRCTYRIRPADRASR